jgi:ATP-dependent Clp protease ATP-binding subunit ClpC
MDEKEPLDPKVRKLMNDAINEAKEYDDSQFRPEHILLSIILDSKNNVIKILRELNINIDSIFEELTEYLKNNILNVRRPLITNINLVPSDSTKYIVNQMNNERLLLGDGTINECHLMLALLKSNSQAQKLLLKFKVNYKKFKDKTKLMNEFNTPDEGFEQEPTSNKKSRTTKKLPTTKTPALDKFCRNISKEAEEGKIDPVVGREKEIKRVTGILSRRKKNNPVLIGKAGVGKTSIVEGLTILINNGDAPRPLLGKKVFALDLASIVAGTKYRGQFEERMKIILDELKNNDEVILFLDELHTLVGAGNASGALDASNILKPALARGEIQIIGATTFDEYREHIENSGALERRFQKVVVEEPTLEESINILSNIKKNYEKYHKVEYPEKIITEIVKLADRYITDRAMPDKAIDIMDEVGATTNIDIKLPKEIKALKEEIILLNREKKDIINKQRYEDAAVIRDKCKLIQNNLDKKMESWETSNNKKITEITENMVTLVISTMTGIPLTKLTTSENNTLKNLDRDLKKEIIGQDEAVTKVSKAIRRSRLGIKRKDKPIGSFIFLGPTGVGKTFLSKILAEHVFGDVDSLIRVDMSEYMEKHAMSKLIGAPPGYVGYSEGGKLTEAVRRRPYAVILFDEIEKAHNDIFNLLLQLLDEGHLTDSLGRKVDFKNTVIIMTSNIGVKKLAQFGKSIGYGTKNNIIDDELRIKNIIKKALKDKFPPEFLNRIDETIIFNSLTPEHINVIIVNEINELKKRMFELGYKLILNKSIINYVAKEGYHKEYGARPLTRAIQKYIEDPITDAVMDGDLKEGGTIKLSYTPKSGVITKVT